MRVQGWRMWSVSCGGVGYRVYVCGSVGSVCVGMWDGVVRCGMEVYCCLILESRLKEIIIWENKLITIFSLIVVFLAVTES